MNNNVGDLIDRFCDKGILIDTNLLLVLLVGNIDPRLIGKVARTNDYSRNDYERIRDVLAPFSRFIILPQVLTEAGNLLKRNCRSETILQDLHLELQRFVHSDAVCEARSLSRRITAHAAFSKLGYADAAILNAASGKYLIFTDDGPLQHMAWNIGTAVLPFGWLTVI